MAFHSSLFTPIGLAVFVAMCACLLILADAIAGLA